MIYRDHSTSLERSKFSLKHTVDSKDYQDFNYRFCSLKVTQFTNGLFSKGAILIFRNCATTSILFLRPCLHSTAKYLSIHPYKRSHQKEKHTATVMFKFRATKIKEQQYFLQPRYPKASMLSLHNSEPSIQNLLAMSFLCRYRLLLVKNSHFVKNRLFQQY